MQTIAMIFMAAGSFFIAAIQIRGIIVGRWPMWGLSSKLGMPLDSVEKKLAIAGGVSFFIGLVAACASF